MSTYLKIVQEMKKELKTKWAKQDKVACLQVSIQACKLLHDTSNAKFHAVKFGYVMEIVEEFGINVFERIKRLSFPGLTEERVKELNISDLRGANIPESAQEICKNWINKISSIRELIPRLIIETTLLRLYFFIDNGVNAQKVLKRLARSNRCFGEYINVQLTRCSVSSSALSWCGWGGKCCPSRRTSSWTSWTTCSSTSSRARAYSIGTTSHTTSSLPS